MSFQIFVANLRLKQKEGAAETNFEYNTDILTCLLDVLTVAW